MKAPPPGPARGQAFTLVEVLVAIAVLSIMLIFLGTVVASVSVVSHGAQQNAETSGNARSLLDLMSRELAAGVSRPDLNQTNWIAVTGNGSTLNFYSRNTGSVIAGSAASTSSTYRPLSNIEYTWNRSATNSFLGRADQAVLWTSAPSAAIPLGYSTVTTPTFNPIDVLDGVVAFQVTFLQQDGTFSATYSGTGTLAATVSFALVDTDSLKLLISTSRLQPLSTFLTSASQGSTKAQTSGGSATSPRMDWETAVNSSTGLNAYPTQVRTGLHFFERTIDLPKPTL